jgi:hypothetical protein
MRAAGEAVDPEVKLRLWRQALALAPTDDRVRLGTLRAAIALPRDSLALALVQAGALGVGFNEGLNEEVHFYRRHGRYQSYRQPGAASVLPEIQITADERASISESLAAAAERLDDLNTAQSYLRTAIELHKASQSGGAHDALQPRLDALIAEQERRTRNAARQPVIRDVIAQDQVVRPRIPIGKPGSAQ